MTRQLVRRAVKVVCSLIFMGVSLANAGSYDDFFRAIRQDNPAKMEELLSRGFDANTVNTNGQYGLYIALGDGALKVAKTLINWSQTDVNKLNLKDESPLMLAALKENLELVQMLIQRGADVNKTGWAPLHYAASKGNLEIVALLVENSAYIDAESPNGTTPLMMAAMYGTPATVGFLLQEGADPQLKNQRGMTALQFAQQGNRPDSVEVIAKFLRGKQPAGQW